MSFAEPLRLSLLALPALAVLLVLYRHRSRLQQQRRLASPGVWRRLMGGVPATGVLRLIIWCGAAALLAVAVARPQWGESPAEETVRTRDLVIALDVSDSMLCEDLRPSRLTRSTEALIRLLPQLEGNRVAVVVFAGEAYSLVPLTTDLSAVAVFLEGVGPGMVALPGSNLQRAADGALRLLPPEGEGRVMILFTDGENLQGDVNAATTALSEAEVGLLGVVAGTERGGPIPEHDERGGVHYKRDQNGQPVVTRAHPEVLEEIAAMVDGEVVSLGDPEVVRGIADAVARLRTREVEETRNVRRIERFPFFLVGAAALLALGFLVSPWRRLAATTVILVLALPSVSAAQDVSQTTSAPRVQAPPETVDQPSAEEPLPPASWWQRLIPGGSRRLARRGAAEWRNQDLAGAAASFAGAAELDPEQPERLYDLGTALAAGGRLETATPLLDAADRGGVAGAAYNSGTAALVQSQADPALEWLRKAMLADPDDLEAKHNYELALKLRDQQQQQQQQQQDQQQNQENEDQQEEEKDENGQPPTPTPSQGQGAAPTPTPNPNQPLFAALERAEAEAREALRSPTPKAGKVEKDW